MGAIVPVALLHAASVGALMAAALAGSSTLLLAALAAAAGVGFSPIFAALRTLWASLVPDESNLGVAYALQAAVQEVSFVAGPLAAAALIAVTSPAVALAVTTATTVVASVAFAASAASRAWRPQRVRRDGLGALGALRSAGLRILAASAIPTSAAFGIAEVALPAFAAREGAAAAGGVLLALFSAASLAGGLWFGTRRWRGSVLARYVAVTALLAAGLAVLPGAESLLAMGVLVLVAGAPVAAMITCRYQLLDRVAPTGAANEAFMWISTAEGGGVALGQAVAGTLVEERGIEAALLCSAAAAAISTLITLAGRRSLVDPKPVRA